jgi:hypothetical protein
MRCETLNREAVFVEDFLQRHPVHLGHDVIANPISNGQTEVALLPQQPTDEQIVEDEGAQQNGAVDIERRNTRREFYRAPPMEISFQTKKEYGRFRPYSFRMMVYAFLVGDILGPAASDWNDRRALYTAQFK